MTTNEFSIDLTAAANDLGCAFAEGAGYIADALKETLSASHAERDALWIDPNQPQNVVHGLFAIAHALNRIADAFGAASGRRINERPKDR
jgi:hypothetical protein